METVLFHCQWEWKIVETSCVGICYHIPLKTQKLSISYTILFLEIYLKWICYKCSQGENRKFACGEPFYIAVGHTDTWEYSQDTKHQLTQGGAWLMPSKMNQSLALKSYPTCKGRWPELTFSLLPTNIMASTQAIPAAALSNQARAKEMPSHTIQLSELLSGQS